MTWKTICFVAVACSLLAHSPARGESLPFAGLDDLRGPYEGTGMFGEALHVQPLGMAGNWPICAVWSSDRTTKSPYLGFGWSIPALESRFVPLDVRRWAFYQPDGYVRIFVQVDRKESNVLTGGPAWTAIVKDDLIRVTADPHDGGPKSEFTFRQGRLVRMICEEGSFDVKYTGRVADGITSHGKTLLEATRESGPEKRAVFRFNGGRAQVVAVCRPATVFGPRANHLRQCRHRKTALRASRRPTGQWTSRTPVSDTKATPRSRRWASPASTTRSRNTRAPPSSTAASPRCRTGPTSFPPRPRWRTSSTRPSTRSSTTSAYPSNSACSCRNPSAQDGAPNDACLRKPVLLQGASPLGLRPGRTLVNSHFTWLVEMGWLGRIGYVCGLAFLFAVGIVRLRVRGDPIPLAVLTSFATSAFFSSVAEEWLVCAVPLALTLPALKSFIFDATTRMRWASAVAALLTGCSLLGAVAIAGNTFRPTDTIPLRKSPDGTRIVVGDGAPSAWAVCDPVAMGGPEFGRPLRGFARTPEEHGRAYGLASDLATVPDDVHHLALCGQAANIKANALSRFGALSGVRVIAPKKPQEWLAARAQMPYIRVFCGEFAKSCPENDVEGLAVVLGAQDYLPDWPRLAFADMSP